MTSWVSDGHDAPPDFDSPDASEICPSAMRTALLNPEGRVFPLALLTLNTAAVEAAVGIVFSDNLGTEDFVMRPLRLNDVIVKSDFPNFL